MDLARQQVLEFADAFGGRTAAYKAIAAASDGSLDWQYVRKFANNHPECSNPTVAKLDSLIAATTAATEQQAAA